MLSFARLYFQFSKLESILGRHSLSILNSNPIKYNECRTHMNQFIYTHQSTNELFLRKRLNMLFAIANLGEALQSHRQSLYKSVMVEQIRSQEELDRIVNWLTSQVRINNNIVDKDIIDKIQSWSLGNDELPKLINELQEFLRVQGVNLDISELSGKMRSKFPSISGNTIYCQIKKRFTNNPVKENKLIWDKLGGLKPRLLPYETNSANVYAEHLKVTQGKLRFRFPPQPNGYLHIGHCKSIRINFETAKRMNGICFLRFDDTNPDSQSSEYIENILKEVKWMGYQPDQVTYASDYFQNLIEYAIQLIKLGKAYVCSTSRTAIHEERKNKESNLQRDLPVEYSLKNFPNLLPHQTLRLKLDSTSVNPTLRDPVIYRTKDKPHPRTGYKYRIYPTYDFTHCISDSIENIDYSLCSLQFQIRRQLYYLILDMLGLYKPVVWEYSRLNIQGNVLSKRKIIKLVQDRTVEGWDDPRLLTIAGLRNRGYTPTMINSFIDRINVARAGNENVIQANVLQLEMRKELNKTAERTMAVLEPAKLTLTNLEKDQLLVVSLMPELPGKGTRTIKLTKQIWIDSKENLNVGKQINLKYFKRIKITKIIESSEFKKQFEAQILSSTIDSKKIVNIHWISSIDGITTNVTEYLQLFPDNTETNVNLHTIQTYPFAIVPRNLLVDKTYQFERVGYFKFHNGSLICCCRLV